MARMLFVALLLAGCHGNSTLDVTLLRSLLVDEDPFAGVDTLELRWSRPGMAAKIDHVAYSAASPLHLAPPALVDGSRLEIAALSAGSVVAVGRTAPLSKSANAARAYVGLVDRFSATPTARAIASARFGASATLLGDGRVLLVGGATRGSPGVPDASSISSRVELYDPATGSFTVLMAPAFGERIYHAVAATRDGGALIIGGLGKFGAHDDLFRFDAQGGLAGAGTLPGPRYGAAAAALADGSIILVGGYSAPDGMGGGTLAPDAVLLSSDGSASLVALPSPRAFAVATVLADGSVLVTGGVDTMGPRADALVYSPASRSFAAPSAGGGHATMHSARVGHSATPLPSGDVFFYGGNDGHASIAAPELYAASAGGFVDAPTFNLPARERHATVALPDGSVLLVGGESSPQRMAVPSPVLGLMRFAPGATGASGTFATDLPDAPARAEADAVLLPDGSVLFAGGAVGDPRTVAGGAQLFVACFDACLAVSP